VAVVHQTGFIGDVIDWIAGGPQKRERAAKALSEARALRLEAGRVQKQLEDVQAKIAAGGGSDQMLWAIPAVVLGALVILGGEQ